jgi:UTP--glucose-1-phosphate uridylyltransferase
MQLKRSMLTIFLSALRRVMNGGGMELDIIVNPKLTDDGQAVIQVGRLIRGLRDTYSNFWQLETAAGAAIKHFRNAHGINVPRSRFLPVKSCSDLLLIRSNIYSLQDGRLHMSEGRMFGSVPVIKLGDHFKKVGALLGLGCSFR